MTAPYRHVPRDQEYTEGSRKGEKLPPAFQNPNDIMDIVRLIQHATSKNPMIKELLDYQGTPGSFYGKFSDRPGTSGDYFDLQRLIAGGGMDYESSYPIKSVSGSMGGYVNPKNKWYEGQGDVTTRNPGINDLVNHILNFTQNQGSNGNRPPVESPTSYSGSWAPQDILTGSSVEDTSKGSDFDLKYGETELHEVPQAARYKNAHENIDAEIQKNTLVDYILRMFK